MTSQIKFFWKPPDGAAIIGVVPYEGMIVVTTSSGVYVIKQAHQSLENYAVHKIGNTPWQPPSK